MLVQVVVVGTGVAVVVVVVVMVVAVLVAGAGEEDEVEEEAALCAPLPPSQVVQASCTPAVPENMKRNFSLPEEPVKSTVTENSEAWKNVVTAWSFSALCSVKGSRGRSERASEEGTKDMLCWSFVDSPFRMVSLERQYFWNPFKDPFRVSLSEGSVTKSVK